MTPHTAYLLKAGTVCTRPGKIATAPYPDLAEQDLAGKLWVLVTYKRSGKTRTAMFSTFGGEEFVPGEIIHAYDDINHTTPFPSGDGRHRPEVCTVRAVHASLADFESDPNYPFNGTCPHYVYK